MNYVLNLCVNFITLKSKSFFALQAIRKFFSKPYQDRIARLSILQFTSLGTLHMNVSRVPFGTRYFDIPGQGGSRDPVRFAFSTHPVSLSLAFVNFQMASSYVLIKTSRSGGVERAGLPFGNIFPTFATKAVAATGSRNPSAPFSPVYRPKR